MDIAISIDVHKYTGHSLERKAKRSDMKNRIVNEIPTIISIVEEDWKIK